MSKIKIRDCKSACSPLEFYLEQMTPTQIALKATRNSEVWKILTIDCVERKIIRHGGLGALADTFDLHKGMIKMDTD